MGSRGGYYSGEQRKKKKKDLEKKAKKLSFKKASVLPKVRIEK